LLRVVVTQGAGAQQTSSIVELSSVIFSSIVELSSVIFSSNGEGRSVAMREQ